MSVAYDPKTFINEGAYPSLDDQQDAHDQRFPDPDNDVAEQLRRFTNDDSMLAETERALLANDDDDVSHADLHQQLDMNMSTAGFTSPIAAPAPVPTHVQIQQGLDKPSHLQTHAQVQPHIQQALSDSASPDATSGSAPGDDGHPLRGKLRAQAKPNRDVTKQADGKYHCPNHDCKEDVKSFLRKCEWNKHMDKHERPYVCTAEGCEGLPGFTYSGGLLRHEREVHGKHGGPRNTVNCPHKSCKRHTGKGFSRLENLNEHLRRVHTNPTTGALAPIEPNGVTPAAGSYLDRDAGKDAQVAVGEKRKRPLLDLVDDEAYERQIRHSARLADEETEREHQAHLHGSQQPPHDLKSPPPNSHRGQYRAVHKEMMTALRDIRALHLALVPQLREKGLYDLADDVDRVTAKHTLTTPKFEQLTPLESNFSPSPSPERTGPAF